MIFMVLGLRKLAGLMLALGVLLALTACGGMIDDRKAEEPLSGGMLSQIRAIGSTPGDPMMMRIIKQESVLEVWKRTSSGRFALLKTYKICAWSGGLGPKIVEGDRQSPEGFYTITPGLLNPHSNYYLAFNTGYPNKFDTAYGRTGSNLMIHGDCSSSGCYAMTDAEIAEIYALARESLKGGNPNVQLEIFPFRMTPQNLAKVSADPNMGFWKNIKTGYDAFELTRSPPNWDVCDKKYIFNMRSPAGTPLDPVAPCPALTADATLAAALSAKQAVDDAAFSKALADAAAKQAADAALTEKAANEKAAIAARGEAVGGFFTGIFGGNKAAPVKPVDPVTVDPTEPPPIPMPALVRA